MSAAFSVVPEVLNQPWQDGKYSFDRDLLIHLIDKQLQEGSSIGGLAIALDVWLATELRSAGIGRDAIWPRPDQPRVLPQATARAAADFKFSRDKSTRVVQERTIEKIVKSAGSSSSNILGGFFGKEIDVVMAEFDRGLELGISSKTMTDSFAKNITNRFEEASGDLLNIRRRYPLATFGYVYLVTENVFDQAAGWERIKDMLRKLKSLSPGDDRGSYDSTCLIVIDRTASTPRLLEDRVPADLSPDAFFETMLKRLFSRSPVSEHEDARESWARSLSRPDGSDGSRD